MSLTLTGTTDSLQVLLDAAPTTQLPWKCSWSDRNTVNSGSPAGLTTGVTAATMVPAPASGVTRFVSRVKIYNADAAARVVTVQSLVGGVANIEAKVTLQPGCHLMYGGNDWYVLDANGARVTTSSPASNGQPGDGLNLLPDGSIRANQLGFAGGAMAAHAYGYDFWGGGTGGCNVTVNATTGVVTHTSGTMVSVLEAPRIAGQQVTCSVGDPSGPVTVGIDGITSVIPAGAGRQSAAITVPSGSTGNPVFSISGTGVTYHDVKVERGAVATPYRYDDFGTILQRAYRRLYSTFPYGAVPSNGANSSLLVELKSYGGTGVVGAAPLPVPMLGNPTVTFYSSAQGTPTAGQWQALISGYVNTSVLGVQVPNAKQINYSATLAGATTGFTYYAYGHFVADSRLPI